MQSHTKKRLECLAPMMSALGTALVMGTLLVTLVLECQLHPPGHELGAVVLLGMVLLAVIVGVTVAAAQHLKEIRRGEVDDARQY